MPNLKPPAQGADWTRLLADPDLLNHLGELLQTYRDAPLETRDEALLEMMRKIKRNAAKPGKARKVPSPSVEVPVPVAVAIPAAVAPPVMDAPLATAAVAAAVAAPAIATAPPVSVPVAAAATPPFEPSSMFTPSTGDRRRYPRIKCFVVVELRVAGSDTPIWGNLSNTSVGGCLVETAAVVEAGAKLEIGLWVTSGQIWVKGIILNGIVARSNASGGLRVKFAEMENAERETLRQFLKFVETTTKSHASDHGYLAQLKR
jgi:hypothetical protein